MREVRIKCVLLGEEATGKTSIVNRYTKGVFNQYSQSTIGAAFNAKPLTKDGFNVKLDIWDTAGQERYRSMTPMYYRNADIAFICVDLSRKNIEDSFRYWFKALKEYNDCEGRIIYLVGTKSDIKEKWCELEISNILDMNPSIKFLETSSKTNQNIGKLFDLATEDALVNYKQEGLERDTKQMALIPKNQPQGRKWFCNIL